MTVLIGASVLLIAGSAIALVFGWVSANESLIWTSIVASFGAAIALALAFLRSRVEASALARRTAAQNAPATQATTGGGQAATDVGSDASVVGVSSSSRYHRPECRYASAKGAEAMTLAAARKEGYRPCGICKP
jgi:hypothetical protein